MVLRIVRFRYEKNKKDTLKQIPFFRKKRVKYYRYDFLILRSYTINDDANRPDKERYQMDEDILTDGKMKRRGFSARFPERKCPFSGTKID